jgi:RNA polymerase sigma factor (sigma-70 family)
MVTYQNKHGSIASKRRYRRPTVQGRLDVVVSQNTTRNREQATLRNPASIGEVLEERLCESLALVFGFAWKCMHLSTVDSEEVACETIVILLRHLQKMDERDSLRFIGDRNRVDGWLRRTARYLVYRRLRRKQVESRYLRRGSFLARRDLEPITPDASYTVEQIHYVLDSCSKRDRKIAQLVMDGISQTTIAMLLAIDRATVWRALRKIGQTLQQNFGKFRE